MGDKISDQQLRRRLLAYTAAVPPVTDSTRKILLKKLANFESGQTDKNAASKIMPPPKAKAPASSTNESVMISSSVESVQQSQHTTFDNADSPRKSTRRRRTYRAPDPFDTSDSEVDNSSFGRSILPTNPYMASSSPKSNETSFMNVSSWKNGTDQNQDFYLSPEIKKSSNETSHEPSEKVTTTFFDSKVSKPTKTEPPVAQNLRSSSVIETKSHADQAIQRWKEKMMKKSQEPDDTSNTSIFNSSSPSIKMTPQNLRRNYQSTQQRFPGNLYTKNNQYIIILLFIGFFALIFGLYFISIQPSTVVLPSGILSSLCSKKNLQGPNCDAEQEKLQRLYNSLVSQVQDRYLKNQCDTVDIEPTVDVQTVFEYISTHENMPSREIEELIELLKSIAKTYSDSPIGFDTSFKINVPPNLPVMCAVKNIFSNMFFLTTWLGIVGLSVIGLYFVICFITAKSEKYKQEVNQLVESTINLLKERAENRPDESYLPIIHIRDHLIPFNERQDKSKIWAEVVQYFTESESRVRFEVQEIDGEDFEVWKWVQPTSPGI